VLAVSGGDGTAGFVLTAFERAYGDTPLPRVALLRGGTMNTVANGMGMPRRGAVELLERLVTALGADGGGLVSSPRVAMAIEHEDGTRRLGFLFGMGLARGFLDEYYARGTPHPTPVTAARTLGAIAGSILVWGETARRVVSPVDVSIELDGVRWPKERFLVILAGTVPQVGLGFAPFFRVREGIDAFQVVGVHGPPTAVVARLHRVWLGRHIGDAVGNEALVRRATFRCPSGEVPYFLDGDLYRAEGPLDVRVGPRIEFVWPA
jgi:diacylglycerol kinase family enzyme